MALVDMVSASCRYLVILALSADREGSGDGKQGCCACMCRKVKETFSEIGITGKTNHSLKAAWASALFEANVPEKIIQDRTTHKSVKALRMYECTTEHQHHQVSHILSSRNPLLSFHWQNQQQATSNFSMTPSFGILQNCTINICRYYISKNQGKLFRTMIVPSTKSW